MKLLNAWFHRNPKGSVPCLSILRWAMHDAVLRGVGAQPLSAQFQREEGPRKRATRSNMLEKHG